MAWASSPELAAAVSESGGLGILGTAHLSASRLQSEIQRTKSLTDKPFGVNLYYLSPEIEQMVQLTLDEHVPVITTGAGNPGKDIPRWREAGIHVLPLVSSVALAERLQRSGASGFIAEGMEAGGHIGELTTLMLVPQIVNAVETPVLAAGGIVDGRGMAVAFLLGAEGVQMGTRFLCSRECRVHAGYKQAIIEAKDRGTVVTAVSTGHPVRVLKNKLSRKFLKMEREGVPPEEILALGEGGLKKAVLDGDREWGSLMAGQGAAMIKSIKSVKEIIQDTIQEAEQVLRGAARLVE